MLPLSSLGQEGGARLHPGCRRGWKRTGLAFQPPLQRQTLPARAGVEEWFLGRQTVYSVFHDYEVRCMDLGFTWVSSAGVLDMLPYFRGSV